MKISIIIPCYNNAPHLPKCIESVLSQSFGDFELLLLNDGSTDTTLNICEDFQKKDARIKVYSHENKGVSYTRNRGITLALHDYIVFIDADDFIKIDYIERLSASYVDRIWPICGFINAKANKFTENVHYKKLLKIFPTRKITKENFLKLLEFYSLSSPCARIYCKKIIIQNNIKFDKNITYQEDLLFNLKYLSYISEIKLVDYFGYYYVEHVGSSTSRFHKNFDHLDIFNEKLSKMISTLNDEIIVKEFIFQTVLRKISNIFHVNSFKNKPEKLTELATMFKSNYYNSIENYIDRSGINFFLKTILKLKSAKLVYLYFTLNKAFL